MDKFQVYNRTQQTWEDANIKLIPGWSVSFVQDKTTDTGKVKFKYSGNTAPDWHNGDWCRLLHLYGEDTGATYTKKTESITRDNDYIVSSLIKTEYDKNTTELTLNFDEKLDDYAFEVYVNVYAYTSDGKQMQSLSVTHTSGMEYKTFVLDEEFTGFIEFCEEQTDITTNIGVITIQETEEIEYYIPLNHEQFIIANPSMVYDKVNDEWDIQLDLKEPIEITNGIVFETRSFTNQIEKKINNVVYKHDRKNYLDVLQGLLRCTPSNNNVKNSWLSRIKISEKEWLLKQAFNDDTYSESTFYDVLLNKYDSSLGRTPVLLFDIDGETDLPYNNERTEYVLQFLRQDGFDKEDVQLSNILNGASQQIRSSSWENKADGIVSNVDNLSPTTTTTYVSEYLWAVPEIETDDRQISSFDVNSQKGVWILRTPHKIKNIKSIQQLETHIRLVDIPGQGVRGNFLSTTTNFDNILEKKQYDADNILFETRNVIWYEEGTNIIHLNNFYYREGYGNYFRVIYEPLISFRYDDGVDYETIINQIDGQIGETRYSKYLKDYIDSMDKADLTITKTVENWSDIHEIGSRVIDGNNVYLITAISISNRGFDYDVVYQLNQNHFRKNDSIVAPQSIRKNIEIGYNGLTDRKSCYVKGYKISLSNNNVNTTQLEQKYISSSLLTDNQSSLSGVGLEKPQIAKLRMYSIYTDENNNKSLNIIDRLCNGAVTIINDTICFNLRYPDNAICGYEKVLHEYTIGSGGSTSAPLLTSPEEQSPILYTDGFGEIKSFDLSLINVYSEELEDADIYTPSLSELNDIINKTNSYVEATTKYPLTTGIDELTTTYIHTIRSIEYDKDMLDIFNYTFGFKIETDSNIILCRNFYLNSYLVKGVDLGYISGYTTNVQENEVEFNNGVSVTSTLYNNRINIVASTTLTNYKSIVLWDKNQKPVLIINDANKLTQQQFDGQTLNLYC